MKGKRVDEGGKERRKERRRRRVENEEIIDNETRSSGKN
jgi:hypothetical protein